MFDQTLITIFTILNVWFGDGNGAISQAHIAQATSERAQTDRVASQVVATESQTSTLRKRKAGLLNRYESQLKEIDRLKRRRASWRRDRMLRKQLAESHNTARALATLDKQLRALKARVRSLRQRLIASANRELASSPSSARRSRLVAWRDRARRKLRPRAKKIILPDSSVDPLADPEDLDEQAARMAQAERRLARELTTLKRRSERFRRMARLRRLRARAAQLRRLDTNRPRRVTGRVGSGDRNQGAGLSETSDNNGSPAPDDGFAGDPSLDEANPVVVLANVVSSRTLDALRRAQSSNDPAVKAAAAERARKQVKARLERLRKQRLRVMKRSRSLRRRR